MIAQPDILPELAESDASASVRAVYAALREGAASPIAALIWRHTATHPGMLEACWASLEPLFVSGRLQATAWRIARETALHDLLPRIEPRAQVLLGIRTDQAETIKAVVEAYNRANPVNLLAVLTLLSRIDSSASVETVSSVAPTPRLPAIVQPIPRMTPPVEMSADVRWLLNDLRFGDRSNLDAVVPSLFRHLTDWPAYLAVLHIGLAPRFRDGSMAEAVGRVEQAMAAEAAVLARQIAPVQELASTPDLQATMRRFASGVIPMMIIVGFALAEQMSESALPRMIGESRSDPG